MKTLRQFGLAIVTAALVRSAGAADSAFRFDDNGNLQWQTPATLAAPEIVAQPQLQIAEPGEFASFFVVVKDVRNLTYQWHINGTNLSGATSDTLLLTNVSVANEGLYRVVLANNSGSVTSAPAALMLDSDGDSLADSWELTYFGSLAPNPFGDADGDGSANQTEFLDGTNPTNSASAQFQLTLMSDGGQVMASPTKLSYTNGETVTVTATAFPPEVFRGWTGAIASRTNVLSLVMTNSKTLFAHFQAAQITWAASSGGSWHNPSNWNPTLVPTEVDYVTLPNNVTVTISEAAAACRNLTLTAGTLTGNSNLTVYGSFLWTGGTMDGSGRTIIAPGATLTINSPFFTMNLARTLENGGTTVWTGAPGINVNNVITNRAGALFHMQTVPTFGSGGGAPRFDNAGTFRKSTNSGTTTFNIPFNNYGEVDLQIGTLLHNSSFLNNGSVTLAAGTTHRIAGGGSGNGTFNAPATALVDWFGIFTLNTGAQLIGAGIYRVNSATLNCDTDLAVQNLEVLSTLAGSGAMTISNTMSWTGGTLSGSGRTIVAPGANLTINSSFFTLNLARTLENAGTTVWTGPAGINVNNVAITNRAGALFDMQTVPTFGSGGGAPRFDNAGTFRKSANGGAMTFNIPFNNYSLVESLTGTLNLNGGGSHIGTFGVSNGTTLSFGGTHTLTAASSTVGAGSLSVSSGLFTHLGYANITGVKTFGGGTANLNGDYNCTNNSVVVSGGVVNFNGTGVVSPATINSSGTLGGSNLVTVLQQMNWTGGTMDGSGRTVIGPGANLTINSSFFTLNLARTLENGGTTAWTGPAGINVNNVAITNRAGALFHMQTVPTFGSGGGAPRFDNAGTFRKSANSGTTTFNIPFNNYGEVDLQTGTLLHNSSFVNNNSVTVGAGTAHRMASGGSASGTCSNAATALVEWVGGTFTLNTGAQLNGSGLYRINGGTLACNTDATVQFLDILTTLDGSGVVTISNAMTWAGGSMNGSGRTLIAPAATLTINSPFFTLNLARTLENAGTTVWTGPAGINVNNVVITNRAGALFHMQTVPTFGSGGGAPRFDNAGTFRKSANGGTTTFNIPFNNYGHVDLQTGTLLHNSGFVNNNSVSVAAGTAHRMASGGSASGTCSNAATALVEWVGGTFTLNTGAQLNGAGLYRINGGTLACNTDATVQFLDILSALDGSGVVTISNAMNWSGGSMNGSGRTLIAPGANLTINNSPFTISLNRTLENGGTALWTGAAGINVNSVVITNRVGALFHVQNAQPLNISGGTPRFDNAGTFRKSAISGTTTFTIPFNNYGTVDLRTGVLAANSGYNSSAGAWLNSALSGLTPAANFGQLQVAGTVTLHGGLSVELTNSFVPNTNHLFTILAAGTRNGTFTAFHYPSNLVTMVMSNSPNSVIVTSAGLATNGPPAFAKNLPDFQVFYAGRIATQSAAVAGTSPFSYQWKRDGTNLLDGDRITGAQTSALVVSNAALADTGTYEVAVTNAEGFALSSGSTVRVQAVPKFNAIGTGWTLLGTTPPVMNSNNVTLTAGLGNTARSVFYNAPLYIPAFYASFVYRDIGGGGADGITFCIQNHPNGAATLGGGGGGIGYAGITPSAALVMNIYSPNTVGIALRTNGTLPTPGNGAYAPTTPVNIASGNPIHVSLLYTSNVLRVALVESNTANSFTTNFPINLPAVLGAQTAYVGFTAADGAVPSTQVVSNYTFVPLTPITGEKPAPDTLALSWPAVIGGYALQFRSNLTAEADVWQHVTNAVTQVGGRNQATVSATNSGTFYRLSINLNE